MINFKRKTEEAPTEGISVHKIYLKKFLRSILLDMVNNL